MYRCYPLINPITLFLLPSHRLQSKRNAHTNHLKFVKFKLLVERTSLPLSRTQAQHPFQQTLHCESVAVESVCTPASKRNLRRVLQCQSRYFWVAMVPLDSDVRQVVFLVAFLSSFFFPIINTSALRIYPGQGRGVSVRPCFLIRCLVFCWQR